MKHAKWIWHREGDPAIAAPPGHRFFRRLLVLDAERDIASARMAMTADNAFELWVNGQRAGAGDEASQAFRMDVTRWLKPGTNMLAVDGFNAHDEPNPAGLIGALQIQFRDGGTLEVDTDGQWESAVTAPGQWQVEVNRAGWGAAMELGPLGTGAVSCAGTVQAAGLRVPGLRRHHERARADGCAAGLRGGCQPPLHPSACGGHGHLLRLESLATQWCGATAAFRVTGKTPELWNPLTGEVQPAGDLRGARWPHGSAAVAGAVGLGIRRVSQAGGRARARLSRGGCEPRWAGRLAARGAGIA